MAVLVETCEVMENLLSRRKGEGEEMWRQRLEDNLHRLLRESSADRVGAMFSFTLWSGCGLVSCCFG